MQQARKELLVPRLAANLTTMFGEVPFLDRFAAAAAAGFGGVEFLFPYDHPPHAIAERLAATGLQLVLFNAPPGDWDGGERGLAALAGREDAFRRSLDAAIGYARALNVPRLHVMAGLESHGANRRTYVDNLRHVAARLADAGLTLLIEPINRRDMPGYLLHRWADAVAVQDEVGAPNLRLQADLYHLQIAAGDLTRTLQRDIDRIGHVQIAGVPDRHEPDAGEVHYPHLLRLLDDLGYDGWVGCEYRPRGRTEDGLGWRDMLVGQA